MSSPVSSKPFFNSSNKDQYGKFPLQSWVGKVVSYDAQKEQIEKEIRVGDGYVLLIPNVFTPNNDGINDVFEPKFSGFKEIEMHIFDAYGNKLHSSPNTGRVDEISGATIAPALTPWDGSNAELSSKMYICYIVGTLINGETIERTTTFQILKWYEKNNIPLLYFGDGFELSSTIPLPYTDVAE